MLLIFLISFGIWSNLKLCLILKVNDLQKLNVLDLNLN